ncbi:MAG: hypothetical protein H7Y38_14375 [Armatimonadetes bacterium]|nr:hypothetical protein [Armatimonadota bacterium]
MPISSINSYIPTMQAFIEHWQQVNAALGANPLRLKDAYTIALFADALTAIQNAITFVEGRSGARQFVAGQRDQQKAAIAPRLAQFRASVRYLLTGTVYASSLPRAPDISRSEGVFLRPFDDMAVLWTRINDEEGVTGFTPPLQLINDYTLSDFTDELQVLRSTFAALVSADTDLKIARKRRDVLLPTARTRMLQYRAAVLAKFGPDNPLTLSLPKYTPDPGSTPDPVNASGIWDTSINQARLNWTPSTNPRLDRYEIRQSGAATYKTKEESNVANVVRTVTEFVTTAGLVVPGAVNCYKVYVVTEDGNEAGRTR